MSVIELIKELRESNIQITLNDNGKLGIKAPPGALSDDLKVKLKTHKTELLILLENNKASEDAQLKEIKSVAEDDPLPLSFAQQRLWLLHQLDPQSSAYNMSAALFLNGQLNKEALQATLNTLQYRHSILRTVYDANTEGASGEPTQCVVPHRGVVIDQYQCEDIETVKSVIPVKNTKSIEEGGFYTSADDLPISITQWLTEKASLPFDIAKDSVLRVQLVPLNKQQHILQWVVHHIAIDAWSLDILIQEFAILYNAACESHDKEVESLNENLPPLRIQYADFSSWQRENLSGERLDKHISYWRNTIGENPVALELPNDLQRPAIQTYNGDRVCVTLGSDIVEKINTLAGNEFSPFEILLGTFQKLLQQYSGQNEIRVGVPNANRPRIETQNLVGFFVNTLVMQADFNSDLTVNEFFAVVKQRNLDAQDYQDMPFEMLVDALVSDREMSHSPIFQVMFNYLQKDDVNKFDIGGLSLIPLELTQKQAKFDITLTVEAYRDKYNCIFEYNTDLFSPQRIDTFAKHYQTTLNQLVNALTNTPTKLLHTVSALSSKEINTQLFDWNDSCLPVDFEKDLISRFEAQAAQTPHATALIFDVEKGRKPKTITYEQLNAQANQLSHYLATLGVQRNSFIAVSLNRSSNLVVTLLAIQKAGAAYVPVDPNYPLSRRQYIFEHCQPELIITEENLLSSVQDALTNSDGKTSKACPWLCLNESEWIVSNGQTIKNANLPVNNLSLSTTENQLAYTLYTSGSTGNPKGVAISRRAFVNFLCAMQEEVSLTAEDRLLAVTTISFDIAGLELFLPLITGASVVLADSDQARDPSELARIISELSVTTMQATPVTWQMLLDDLIEPSSLLSGMTALCGGEALNAQLANKLIAAEVNLLNVYGPTETTVWSTCYPIKHTIKTAAFIGRPIGNNQCYVLDEHMQPLPVGAIGELYIGGDGLAEGYLYSSEITNEVFVNNPLPSTPGKRLYRTGDKARYLTDGTLEYQGRVDFQVKIRGFRIELAEIERVLNDHSMVEGVVVNAWIDDLGNNRLVAYVIANNKQSEAFEWELLRQYCSDYLPQYMVPEFCVCLQEFPLTDNGKINRKLLPSPDVSHTQNLYVAPNTQTEQWLCDLWQTILNVDKIGVEDNFFTLGGHSLHATRVIAGINQHYKLNIPVKELFASQTPRSLAETVDTRKTQSGVRQTIPITKAANSSVLPLSFAQQRLWMLDKIEESSAHYHLPVVLELTGDLNKDALSFAFNEIIRRHESLRTNFRSINNSVQQVVRSTVDFQIDDFDLSSLNDDNIDSEVKAYNKRIVNRSFDLENDLMLRVQLIRTATSNHTLCVVMHHIASDGWSMSLLVQEFKELYQSFVENRQPLIAELEIQYSDYASWQRQWLQGDNLEQQFSYWSEQLAEIPVVHNIPLDYSRPAIQSYKGASHLSVVGSKLSAQLKAFCQERNSTLFMALHATFSTLLARYSGEPDIVIGSPIANREQAEVSNLIGFFVNTLALRCNLSEGSTFNELLEQSKQTLLSAYDHQQLPFEQLVDHLQPERSASHSPLFQIMLTLQNNEHIELALPGLSIKPQPLSEEFSQFDLNLEVTETIEGLKLRWLYNTDLFKHETISKLADHFNNLITTMLLKPNKSVFELALVNDQEQNYLLNQWNNTHVDFPFDVCIHEQFETQAELTPNKIALIYDDIELTYRDLNRRANQIAHYLVEHHKIQPDDRVGIYQSRSISMVINILAILKAGGAYVPLDPEFPVSRINYMCEDASLRVILTHSNLLTHLTSDEVFSYSKDSLVAIDDKSNVNLDKYCDSNLSVNALGLSKNHLAYVIYTSGSTGKPKGVMVERFGLRNLVNWYKNEYGYNCDDKFLIASSMGFDLTQKNIFSPLVSGGTLILQKSGYFDPQLINSTLVKHAITVTNCAPSLFYPILDDAEKNDYQSLTSLRLLLVGGEPINPKGFSAWLTHNNCNAQLINMYGPTESTDIVTTRNLTSDVQSSLIGSVIDNVTAYVLNASLQVQPVGVVGELYVGGVGVARGYLNNPEQTREKFIDNPFITDQNGSNKLYKTGDKVRRLSNGELEFVGRVDHEVKIRGFRIALGEIEQTIRVLPVIKETIVTVVNQNNADKIVAYVTLLVNKESVNKESIDKESLDEKSIDEDAFVIEQRLRSELEKTLPRYMVPSNVVFLDAFTLTANGKIDRNKLPLPAESCNEKDKEIVLPKTPVEKVLYRIWQDILNVQNLSITDNFFQLGGHSLLVVQMIANAQENGVSISAHHVFAHPTIQSLVESLDGLEIVPLYEAPPNLIPENCSKITSSMLPLVDLSEQEINWIASTVSGGASNIQDIYPLAPLQEGILFHHMMSQGSDPYVLPNILVVPNKSALNEFIAALEFVIKRHDVLRTAFLWEGLSVPVQVVQRAVDLPVNWLEIPNDQSSEEFVRNLCAPEKQWLDVTSGPLLRLQVAKDKATSRHFVLLQFHHLVSDHEGLEILQREIALFNSNSGKSLPPAQPYREFVAHTLNQNEQLDVEGFFGGFLSDIDEPTLPFDLENIQGDGSNIIELRDLVPQAVAKKIRLLAQQYGVTPASLFHLAWAMVISACTGKSDVVFGTVMSGRLQGTKGVANTLGVFMNTLPVRYSFNTNNSESVHDCVLRSHQLLSDLLPYEQCSLTRVTRCSNLTANTPLFSAIINYRHSSSATEPTAENALSVLDWHERTNYPFNLAVDDYDNQSFGLEVQIDRSIDADLILTYTQEAIQTLIENLSSTPDTAINSLCVINKEDFSKQTAQWNNTQRDYSKMCSVEYLFEQQVERSGDKIAARFAENKITYQELDNLSNQLANHLQSSGIGTEQRVIVCQRRSLSMLVSLLAVLKAGAVYVPVDPNYPADRVLYMLHDAEAAAILTDSSVIETGLFSDNTTDYSADNNYADNSYADNNNANNNYANNVSNDKRLLINVDQNIDIKKSSCEKPLHHSSLNDLAYMIYTSGSTGKPKAVQLTRGNMVNFLLAMGELLQPTEKDCLLAVTSLSFDIAVLELFLPLICGAEVFIGEETLAQDGLGIKASLQKFDVTMMQATPVSWKMLLAADWQPSSSFKVLCGGEPFPGELAQQLLDYDALDVWNLYGPTETTVWSSAYRLDANKKLTYQSVPIGNPIANTSLFILNEHLNPVPMGVTGELFIGGDGVARGYLGNSHLTDDRFIDTPFGRLYRTGDLARQRKDGVFECLGRLDHQVKIRGFRIELGEIETCLANHEFVNEAIVHSHEIQGESQLVAYVVLNKDMIEPSKNVNAITELFQKHLRTVLPDYMVPNAFVVMDELPLTPNGKVDRKALPSPSLEKPQNNYVAPRNALESQLQTIWQNLLANNTIGIHDNFFQLGGHSLLATRLMMRCREQFQVKLQLADLFHRQTIAEMAELIEHAQQEADAKTTHLDDASLSRIDDLLSEFED